MPIGITDIGTTIGTIRGTIGRPRGGGPVSDRARLRRRRRALVLGLLALLQPVRRRARGGRWGADRLLATARPGRPGRAAANAQAATDQAGQLMDAAREAFRQNNYAGALTQCDKAIALEPNDPLMHEFRGLVLFALHRFDEAAGCGLCRLSAGPGWDWTTLVGLYPDVDVYTEQLRALEQHVLANVNSAAAKFLLAYHYTICGHTDAAAA